MDMSKEVPYELLNSMQVCMSSFLYIPLTDAESIQNSFVIPGSGIYWKGVAHDGPAYKPIAAAYERAQEISKGGSFIVNVVYEWIPLQKINSVPLHKTAYRRAPKPNCLILIGWPRDAQSEKMVDEARSLVHEIAACVVGGALELKDVKNQPYANYGMISRTLLALVFVLITGCAR